MIGAEPFVIDLCSNCMQQGTDMIAQVPVIGDAVFALGYSRLIGDDKYVITRRIEKLYCLNGTGHEREALDLADMAPIHVDNPVTIEKDRPAASGSNQLALRFSIRFGQSDIDEIAVSRHAAKPSLFCKSREDILLERAGVRKGIDKASAQNVDTGVDQARPRIRALFAEAVNQSLGHFDRSKSAGILHPAQGDNAVELGIGTHFCR